MKYLFLMLFPIIALADPRLKIALIDTGISPGELLPYLCTEGHKDFTGTGLNDTVSHGTAMASYVAQSMNSKTQCLVIIKYYLDSFTLGENNETRMVKSINYAVNENVGYINISGGGSEPFKAERHELELALFHGIRVIVAAGNESKNLTKECNYYPACYRFNHKNFYVVGAMSTTGSVMTYSNYNGPVNEYEVERVCAENLTDEYKYRKCHSGTSVSTAVFTGKLVKKEQR